MTLKAYRHERFSRIYWVEVNGTKRLATENLAEGTQVYGETLVKAEGNEYRLWDPYRSKLGAAILNGLKQLPICEGTSVLYLGAASGTTSSHVSDIVGKRGRVFCVEISPRPMRDLITVCSRRTNMIPIAADARAPSTYAPLLEKVDVIYQDIAQPDQTDIMLKNVRAFLKNGGHGMIVIKARSINVTREPAKILKEETERLEKHVKTMETVDLHPYERDHAMIIFRAY